METATATLDFSARYRVEGQPGIAWYLIDYATEEQYEGDQIICEQRGCDHLLSEMCWAEGETSLVTDYDRVKAVMVGDDRVHEVEVEDLVEIDEDDYCHGCGQIGCGHG